MTPERRVARMVALAAGVITAAVVLLPPGLYVGIRRASEVGAVDAEIALLAHDLSRAVSANPDMWRFEVVRMRELVGRRLPDRGERRVLRGSDGDVVAEAGTEVAFPAIVRSHPILDAGEPVALLEVARTLGPDLVRGGLLLLVLLPVGLGVFLTLSALPLSAIRRSEEALRRERDTVQRYLDVAGVSFVVLDAEGRVTRVNRRTVALLGRVEADLVGRRWVDAFVAEEDRSRVAAEHAAAASQPACVRELRCEVVRPGGERRTVAWLVTPLPRGPGPAGLLGSALDVTDERRLEERLREAQRLEAVGRLAGGVAHDFNNALAAIKGFAGALGAEVPEGDPRREDVLEIVAAVDRASGLTRRLAAFARQQAIALEAVDAGAVVLAAELALREAAGPAAGLTVDVDRSRPLPVLADGAQLEQVLVSLVSNARDAMPDGGPIRLELRAVVLAREDAAPLGLAPGAHVRISVSDRGPGVGPEVRARMFEPFFTTKEVGKGSGLGLAIARAIVQQHGGAIEVGSAEGAGAAVSVLLPLRPDAGRAGGPEGLRSAAG